jgi:hypothetical protein
VAVAARWHPLWEFPLRKKKGRISDAALWE